MYKEKIQLYHDRKIEKINFTVGDAVLFFDSKLNLSPGKLRLIWMGPYRVMTIFPYGSIELENNESSKFKINGKRVKHYLGDIEKVKQICEVVLDEV